MGSCPVYLPDCAGDEFLHFVRFREGIFADAITDTDSRGIWNFRTIVYCSICIWRRFFERNLSHESGIAYQPRCQWCRLWKMGEVEFAIPIFEFDVDQWTVIGRVYDRLLGGKCFGYRTISWLENYKKGSIISAVR